MQELFDADNERFQRNNRVAERIGWAVLSALLVAASVGLFGHGVLADAHVESHDGTLRVRYSRFLRANAVTHVEITPVAPAAASAAVPGGPVIWVSASVYERFVVERVEPEPERVEHTGGRVVFLFAHARPASLRLRLEAERAGVVRATVGVGTSTVEYWQLVYP